MRITNTQGQSHPMHLHGQKFIILSKNVSIIMFKIYVRIYSMKQKGYF